MADPQPAPPAILLNSLLFEHFSHHPSSSSASHDGDSSVSGVASSKIEINASANVYSIGRIINSRKVSKKLAFFDVLLSSPERASSIKIEVIIKAIEVEGGDQGLSDLIYYTALGDTAEIHGYVELPNQNLIHVLPDGYVHGLLLHCKSLKVTKKWKDENPGVAFVPLKSPSASAASSSSSHAKASSSFEPKSRKPCKFWLNTGTCSRGDSCPHVHHNKDEIVDIRRQWVEERISKRKKTSADENDPHPIEEKGAHGARAKVFVDFLVQRLGHDILTAGCGVLDVAGGRGEVSFELLTRRQIPCTLVDPRPLKLNKSQHQFLKQNPEAQVAKQFQCFFPPPPLSEADSSSLHDELRHVTEQCVCFIGMHPDEATEAIVDYGLQQGKPFAVVPCCVFARQFPHRRLKNGAGVATRQDLVQYIFERAQNACETTHPHFVAETHFLPFDGANQVVFFGPPPAKKADAATPAGSESIIE